MAIDPVFFHTEGPMFHDGTVEPEGWYFWHETGADYSGPYATRPDAEAALTEYAKQL